MNLLVQAGASLGGFDSGYADFAVENAVRSGDNDSLQLWALATKTYNEPGADPSEFASLNISSQ